MSEELGVLVNPKRAYFIGNNRDGFPPNGDVIANK